MHNFNIIKKEIEIAGRKLIVETGRMAKQANGSVFITYGNTSILVTATMAKEASEGTDFFPLTVDFIEKMYASGKIPGGFFKREAKPSTDAILSARLIDRAIRPLFPEGFRNAVQIVVTVLSFDGINNPGALGIFGASMALSISDIPFNGPIAGITVGLKNDNIIINPSLLTIEDSDLNLDVAGTENSIVMIEAGANEISEEQMMNAIYEGHEVIKRLVEFQKEFVEETGKEKIEVVLDVIPEEIIKKIESEYGEKIEKAATIHGKLERYAAFDNLKQEMLEKYAQQDNEEEFEQNERYYKNAFEELVKRFVRNAILHKHHRVDGRDLDDIRPITCEIDILSQVHGSALFTRGETQALAIVTLGTEKDEQIVDGLEEEFKKRFFLHYNFPPFSVGETGFMRGPGRRELGHGALAERALRPMMPTEEEFPYTVRIVSEILESNGSSSMATVCSGTLALMAAGVPIKKPVAGIANGLIMEDGEYVVLTDIMGLEDHLGDMDFKVTGTRDGITAMQMDIKIEGISREIMKIALEKAKNARHYILDIFETVIKEPRKEISDTAPQIEQIKIPIDKIGELIGPGGKMIKHIIEETQADINIKDDGTVSIASPDRISINKAKAMISDIVSEPVFGNVYDGVVSRVEVYGAFVKFMSGTKEGLVHISQMHELRLNRVEDMLKVGDKVKVKYIGLDKGKYKLTMKGVKGNPEPKEGSTQSRGDGNRKPYQNDRDRRERDNRGYHRRDRKY
ncbi:MAG: polyribonucleotide nucleotidyltransferase [Candidatus Cloacimonadota bacterium]|nr:MAG: polyribonucleotide nucleotidyltransferase [Candidatus Cloacimonadota bacterium]